MDEIRKQREHTVVSYFLEKYGDAPSGKLVPGESPDFILRTSRKYAIGIELTAIFTRAKPMSLEVLERELREAIAKKGEKLALYRKQRLNRYWLLVTADGLNGLDPGKVEAHVSRLELANGFHDLFLFDLFDGRIYRLK